MSTVLSSFTGNVLNRGISATEVKTIFKAAAVDGFTTQEAADLRLAFDFYKDSFTAAGRTEYSKQLGALTTTLDAYARVTPTGPETRKYVASQVSFGGTARLSQLPILLEGKPAQLVTLEDGVRSSLSISIPGKAPRKITSLDEARALASGLRANAQSATSDAYFAANGFASERNYSTLTFRNARTSVGADRSLNVTADNGVTFNLLKGVVTIDAGIARRELTPAEYASLARAIPYNVSIDVNALYLAVYRKTH